MQKRTILFLGFILLGTPPILPLPSNPPAWKTIRGIFPVLPADHPELKITRGRAIFRGSPFTGTLVEYYQDGSLHRQQQYQRGLRHGWELSFYPDGKILSKRLYQGHKKQGLHQGWWPNGRKKFEIRFQNGKAEGVAREWYPSGQPFTIRNYTAGKESGLQKAWGKQGQLYSNYIVKEGKRYGLIGSKPCDQVEN